MLSVWFKHFINIFFRQILGKPFNSSYDYIYTPFFSTNQIQGERHTDLSQYKKQKTTTHTLPGMKYVTFSAEKVYKNEMIQKTAS